MWLTDSIIGIGLILIFLLSFKYWSFTKNSQLSFLFLTAIFIFKVTLGIFYSYVQTNYYHHPLGGDNAAFFDDAKVIYESFFTFKKDFFKMLFMNQDANPYFLNKYYDDMHYWNDGLATSLYNDNKLFIKCNAVLMFFSNGNIYLHILVLNFISTIGLVALFRAMKVIVVSLPFRLIAVFCIPTVLLWCSAIHKETILLFNIGFVLYFFSCYLQHKTKIYFIVLVLSLFLSLFIKPYISCFIAFFVVVSLLGLYFKRFFQPIIWTTIVILFLSGYYLSQNRSIPHNPWNPLIKKQMEFNFTAVGGYFMFDDFKVIRVELADSNALIMAGHDSLLVPKGFKYEYWLISNLEEKRNETNALKTERFALLHKMPKAGSGFQLDLKVTTFFQYCRAIVLAEYAVLFKPLFFDANNLFAYFSSIENLILLLITLLSLLFFIRQKTTIPATVLLLLLFIMLMFFILGFTVNISGAISRYRAPLMPLLLCVFFSLFPFFNNTDRSA